MKALEETGARGAVDVVTRDASGEISEDWGDMVTVLRAARSALWKARPPMPSQMR